MVRRLQQIPVPEIQLAWRCRWPGKGLQNFAEWWYLATTAAHIGFESWLKRDHLMLMDFAPTWLRCRRSGSGFGGATGKAGPAARAGLPRPEGRRDGHGDRRPLDDRILLREVE
jgi:hypothetical protein